VAAKRGQAGAKRGQTSRSAGLQRLALAVFGATFILLFAIFAVAEGIGNPSISSSDVAVVKGVPDDIGTISKAELARGMLQASSQAQLKAVPKPGTKKYEEVKESALGELINAVWLQGQAEEMGITVTDKQVATELAHIKKQNFKTAAAFQKFLKEAHFTKADVDKRVRLQVLSTQIEQQETKGGSAPTESEVEAYYDAAKSTQYTQPPSRDVRTVVNKDKKKVEAAKRLLDKDDSTANWKKVAAKYSSDPTTKSNGGLQPGLTEELLQGKEPLSGKIFHSAVGVVGEPFNQEGNWFVIEVEKVNPEKVQALKEVKSQISSQLGEQIKQEEFAEFVNDFQSRWTSRTFCASGFVTNRCANYIGGRPASAPPACYEANPKHGLPEACPAPVTATSPARPGSVTLLKPQGERLPQRPRPEGLEEVEGAAASGLEGVVPGATGVPGG